MDEKKPTLVKKVSDTMACTAYAEAGEPCMKKNRLSRTQKNSRRQAVFK
jgi:hypothetical protein